MQREDRVENRIESSGDFNTNIEKGIEEALSLVGQKYENQAEEKENLPFHNREHTKGVMRRTEAILRAIQEAEPSLVADRDINLGRLAAAYHDTVQNYKSEKNKDGELKRVRFAGTKQYREKPENPVDNEMASSNEADAFMVKANENEIIFSNEDRAIVQAAIDATVPGWDTEKKIFKQPNLKEGSSLLELAVAMSDIGVAGMDGSEKYVPEGKALFREENLDILEAISNQETHPIGEDKKKYFTQRMITYLASQVGFAKGLKTKFGMDLQLISSERARKAVEKLFDKFDDSIVKSEEVAREAEGMDFEELVKYMGY